MKPLGYYVSGCPQIDELASVYGDYLEGLTLTEKLLMQAVIARSLFYTQLYNVGEMDEPLTPEDEIATGDYEYEGDQAQQNALFGAVCELGTIEDPSYLASLEIALSNYIAAEMEALAVPA